jgi:hypothetical protein
MEGDLMTIPAERGPAFDDADVPRSLVDRRAAHEADRGLAFDATVPRSLVHRGAVHEVFLTDSIALSDDQFVCAAHLPRYHGMYDDTFTATTGPDLMLMIEVSRQAAILIAHRHQGVPADHQFILLSLDAERLPGSHRLAGGAPLDQAVLEARVIRRKDRAGVPREVELEISMTIGGAPACWVRLQFQCLTRDVYGRMRRGRTAGSVQSLPPVAPADPYLVGRRRPENVAVATATPGTGAYPVRVDITHPFFFDHPLDHIPAMLQFEAVRQAAVHLAASQLTLSSAHAVAVSCRASFTMFAELDAPLEAVARLTPGTRPGPGEPVPVRVRLIQDEAEIAQAEVTLAYVASPTLEDQAA